MVISNMTLIINTIINRLDKVEIALLLSVSDSSLEHVVMTSGVVVSVRVDRDLLLSFIMVIIGVVNFQ